MTYAILGPDNLTVANIISADPDFIKSAYPHAIALVDVVPVPGIGWRYQNGKFSPPPV
jgi:hypothetical protein